jgi:peptidoglycan/xylan/chitin deacetylase (PgdA/CDA1 family)
VPLTRRLLLALAALALATLPVVPAERPAPARTMAVTVDDLPALPSRDVAEMRRITDGVLAALRRHRVTAVGFVNESKLEPAGERAARLALLRSWLDAGHDLGNHTYSHPDLQRVPLEEYERDVLRGEPGIRELLAERERTPRWFRHPMTHTGPTREVRSAFEAFLAEHGYAAAPFTVENADYVFDSARRDALSRGDHATAQRLRAAYVDYTLAVTEQMEALSRDTFGREVPQVLLVHANRTNADALGEVLDRLAGRGYRFVALDAALADEAWRAPDEYVGPRGPSWLYRFRVAKGLPLGLEGEPDPPKWVLDLFRQAQERR